MRQQGYYSLVQFCPDPAKAEVANAGVLLFAPGHRFIDVRMSRVNERIHRFFPEAKLDVKRLNSTKEAIRSRIQLEGAQFQSVADLSAFILTRFDQMRLTPPRSIMVSHPEKTLVALFKELVGGERTPRQKPEPVYPEVDRLFTSPQMRPHVVCGKSVVVPVLGRQLEIPYSFKNGLLHLVKPYWFATSDAAITMGFEGQMLAKEPDEEGNTRKLTVLPRVKPLNKEKDLETKVVSIFREYDVRTVTETEVPAYLDEVVQLVAAY